MMDAQTLRDLAQNSCLPYGNQLGDQLGGIADGKTVYIIASGPSAKDFTSELRAKAKAEGAWVIACNAMVLHTSEPDIWLTSEGTIGKLDKDGEPQFPWFYEAGGFAGTVVWERHAVRNAEAEKFVSTYNEDFLKRVVWHSRFYWRDHTSIRNIGQYRYNGWSNDGLWYMEWAELKTKFNGEHTEPLGTVLLQAIHLAGIMGAAKIVIYGGELYFPGGKQHAYTDNADYSKGDGLTGVVSFTMVNGEPKLKASGEYQSTRFFIESSLAIRQVIEQAKRDHPDLTFEDRSGGLLSPGVMGKVTALDVPHDTHGKPKAKGK